jgi:AcrR family transcriptional regulator
MSRALWKQVCFLKYGSLLGILKDRKQICFLMVDQKEPTPTRERILETVDRLFYRQGIRAVGVDAIAAELGISKKTLYRHFPSKDDLIVAYLKGRFRPLPTASDKPPAEQILKNFEWFARSLAMAEDYRGCAFLNALAELGSEEGEARKLAVAYKESRRLWYRALLSRLDVDDPDTLATQLALLIDGAYAAMLVRKDPTVGHAAIAAARVLLKNAGIHIAAGKPTSPTFKHPGRKPS